MASEDLTILKSAIAALDARWNELKELAQQPRPDDEIGDILDQMDFVTAELAQTRALVGHIEAARIVVTPPSKEEEETLRKSLAAMSVHIAKDQKWEAAFKITKNVLDAAIQIKKNIKDRDSKANKKKDGN